MTAALHPLPPRRRSWRDALAALVLLAFAGPGLAGCGSINPATGEQSFTAFMSPEQEKQIGREQHPKVVREFGGVYEDAELQRYVEAIGQRLARQSETPELDFTFTVLDNEMVNAFALPGGYVYVTRGLVALANSEAELAGVIGHEIGHVVARHQAQRYSRGVVAGLGAAILGAVINVPGVGELAQAGSQVYLAGFSREQEFEADMLGVRYLDRAGYDTRAMASFLATMQLQDQLQAELAGRSAEGGASLLATHPRTPDRVRRAIEQVKPRPSPHAETGRDAFLQRIDGLLYGENPEQGLVRGQAFIHPVLGFRFEVPAGFRLANGANEVAAVSRGGTQVVFDGRRVQPSQDLRGYLSEVWARQIRLSNLQTLSVGGMEAATGVTAADTRQGRYVLRLAAIRFAPDMVYRFLFAAPAGRAEALNAVARETLESFRRLSPAEAAAAKPYRLQVVAARPGDTAESLAARLPFESKKLERFRVLNGLEPGETLRPGDKVKLVVQ